ncbi:hypothetical protein [Apilactobacillus timberlakei]|uniref:hypothetical protein n=1 Tax=Apilactobacillus timberlakei TaxID=2008380 RepID=UPI00112EA79A|nr:hypothetical protein [Apilactobacillus timberlakei]TPR16735.1 hypothetical protein DYZ95_07075 [Apilactobacillus timberlakei]TPR21498.1 hypothetical protein DY083_05625 [Apilactobacillus timberlakei]
MGKILAYILTAISSVVFIVIIFSLSMFFNRLYMMNNYNTAAEKIIARSGGLNRGAKQQLDSISKDHYQNMFSIASNDTNVSYYKNINYTIHANIPFNNLGTSDKTKTVQVYTQNYNVKSLIRKNSQVYK